MHKLLDKIDFGNEAGDDESPELLSEYFVEHENFNSFFSNHNKLQISTARKGVGKSALINWTQYKIEKNDPDALVINCRGAELVRDKFGLSSSLSSPNDHIQDWMVRICAMVNRRLAKEIGFAGNDDLITLVEAAEIEGYKRRNLVTSLLNRFQTLLGDRAVSKEKIHNEIEILKRIEHRKVWILIDDLDATYQKTESESLELATFFSACRYLMRDIDDIFFRVTIRSDVWSLLRRYDESLDKTEQYVKEILWNQSDFLKLLYLRVKTSMRALDMPLPKVPEHVRASDAMERLLSEVFVPKMDWAERQKSTYEVLYTLSYERPRWAIQLCKLARESALRHKAEKIDKDHIDDIWGEYGAKRISDLVAEHKHQAPKVEELLNAFRGAPRLFTRDELLSWINNHIATHMATTIEGSSTRSAKDIAHFLYRIGFVLARSDDEYGHYEHYRFDQMPDFLTSRTNDDFGLKWEIHPCYRQALDIKKLDRSHRERFYRQRGSSFYNFDRDEL